LTLAILLDISIREQKQNPKVDGKIMKKIRIVMADDHHVVRLGVSALLSTVQDFDVVGQAANGEEAVAAVKKHSAE
jgi:hypothetical protein